MRRVWAALVLGACSFSHGSSPSDGATDPRADAAADGDVRADAAPGDAPPFDAALCPASYADTLAASKSRYRIDQTLMTAWPLLEACKQDHLGWTHAVVFDSMAELTELDILLDSRATTSRFWIGGVQNPAATTTNAGWIGFGGAPLLASAWHTPENEPDDLDGTENGGQQLLILDRMLQYFHDATGPGPYGVICECDGVPVHPTAQQYVDTDPNNPN